MVKDFNDFDIEICNTTLEKLKDNALNIYNKYESGE